MFFFFFTEKGNFTLELLSSAQVDMGGPKARRVFSPPKKNTKGRPTPLCKFMMGINLKKEEVGNGNGHLW